MNNGHTVQVNIDHENNKCLLSIHGKTYSLKQFEMEMHLVHTNEEGEIAVLGFIFTVKTKYVKTNFELTKTRALLQGQEGALREVEAAADDEWDDNVVAAKGLMDGNDFLAQFWDQLPASKTSEDIPLEQPL